MFQLPCSVQRADAAQCGSVLHSGKAACVAVRQHAQLCAAAVACAGLRVTVRSAVAAHCRQAGGHQWHGRSGKSLSSPFWTCVPNRFYIRADSSKTSGSWHGRSAIIPCCTARNSACLPCSPSARLQAMSAFIIVSAALITALVMLAAEVFGCCSSCCSRVRSFRAESSKLTAVGRLHTPLSTVYSHLRITPSISEQAASV